MPCRQRHEGQRNGHLPAQRVLFGGGGGVHLALRNPAMQGRQWLARLPATA